MKVHNYSRDTGEYISSTDARESPLEPDVFLVPAYATTTSPPDVGQNQAAVWGGSSWSVVPDHRGETYWDTSGEMVVIEGLGVSPESDWVTDRPGPTPDGLILAQIAALEARQTPRRIREAALTQDGRDWLSDLDVQITALRAQLS
jgi:hypothetical protein